MVIWYVKCPVCGGTTAALAKNQTLWRAAQHINQLHGAVADVEKLMKHVEVELP